MGLAANETELIGSWKVISGRIVEDETSKRIRALTKSELRLVALSDEGWERLYEDPQDHRLWELTYPSGEMQGGGPPTLRAVAEPIARTKYKLHD